MPRLVALVAPTALLVLVSPAQAADFTVGSTGEVRYLASLPPDFVVDALGTTVGQGAVLEQRYRVGLGLAAKGWRVSTEWDLFTGQIAGDAWDLTGTQDVRNRGEIGVLDADSFVARRAAIEGTIGHVAFEGGWMTADWGLGMVANNGARTPTFGHNAFGDRVVRARAAVRPRAGEDPLVVFALDRVIDDENARWDLGQVAWQGAAAVVRTKGETRGGGTLVYRDQTEADHLRATHAIMLDLYGETGGEAPSGRQWHAGIEAAAIGGQTTRLLTYSSPDGVAIASAGATGYVAMAGAQRRTTLTLRAGWASGDGDPADEVTHDFTFDRDYDVGMVLFDEYQGAIAAQAYTLATDPEHTGVPQAGVDALVNEGAFHGASFVQPVVDVVPTDWLSLRFGVLGAVATAPVAHPYYTFRNGGVPTNQVGLATSGYGLGTELDWAARFHAPDGRRLAMELLLQGGYARPTVANGNPDGDWLSLHTATVRVGW